MLVHNINPVLAQLGPFQIRYYGLLYIVGIILSYYICLHLIQKKQLNISKATLNDLIFAGVLGGIIGARLFYCLIYNFSYYFSNPLEFFFIWQGGLSFHGGLVGGAISIYFFCRKRNLNFFEIADLSVIPFSLALAIGRIGNFINGELPGRVTTLPWCFQFPDVEGCRHPAQLYASFKDLTIFAVLWFIKDKKWKQGMLFALFLLLYSSFRFTVEFFREADQQLGYFAGLSMGQILSIAVFLGGIVLFFRLREGK